MSTKPPNPRSAEVEVDSIFTDRWSPRAFLPDPLPGHQIQALFEAARWAPSCFNEQPWFFLYATEPEDREIFASILVKKNQVWAGRAPLLMFAIARRKFQQSGKENRHAPFDTGAAWLSLALQARRFGLYAHAMAGFNLAKAHRCWAFPKRIIISWRPLPLGVKATRSTFPRICVKWKHPIPANHCRKWRLRPILWCPAIRIQVNRSIKVHAF